MSVGLVDLSNPKAPRFAQVNGNTMMYGASLPKLMVLLAAFQGFEDCTLKDTPEVHRDLIEMIRRSDNLAASQMIGRIGLRKIEALASDRRYRFYDPQKGGGIWLGGTYSSWRREESRTQDGFVLHGHGLPALPVLLPAGLRPAHQPGALAPNAENPGVSRSSRQVCLGAGENRAPGRLYRKSGEVRGFHADSVLVWDSGWRRYILVSMIEDDRGEQILKELVPVAENVLRPSQPRR